MRFSAVSAAGNCIAVHCEGGDVLVYHANDMKLRWRHTFDDGVEQLALNANASRLALVDRQNVLQVVAIPRLGHHSTALMAARPPTVLFSAQSAWFVLWSMDDPEALAFMEKAQLYILNDTQVEEPLATSGRPSRFSDLEIDCVALDWLIAANHSRTLESSRFLYTFETKILRDVKKLLEESRFEEAFQRIQTRPRKRLWTAAAQSALHHAEFSFAERAFTECSDYAGVQFVKKVQLARPLFVRKTMIAYYEQRFDDAESLYVEHGRPDLAIELRLRLGDLPAAESLMKEHEYENEDTKKRLLDSFGDSCAETGQWRKAVHFFTQSKNHARLIDPLFWSSNVKGLIKLAKEIPEQDALLTEVGDKLERLGMCTEAVYAFRKSGSINRAMECCLRLNDWGLAAELSQLVDSPQMESLLHQRVNEFLRTGQQITAASLYSSVGRHLDASRLLKGIAKEFDQTQTNPAILKKLYVLRALELSKHRNRLLRDSLERLPATAELTGRIVLGAAIKPTAWTLEGLATLDESPEADVEEAWREAEAYHFLTLGNRMIHEANSEGAMRCLLHLQKFVDIIKPEIVYSLLALTSYRSGFLKQTSKAFVQLENAADIAEDRKKAYRRIAMQIFTRCAPEDSRTTSETKHNDSWKRRLSKESQPQAACLRTAKCIRDKTRRQLCQTCGRSWLDVRAIVSACVLCGADAG